MRCRQLDRLCNELKPVPRAVRHVSSEVQLMALRLHPAQVCDCAVEPLSNSRLLAENAHDSLQLTRRVTGECICAVSMSDECFVFLLACLQALFAAAQANAQDPTAH